MNQNFRPHSRVEEDTEQDGKLIEASYLEDDAPGADRPSLLLSEALGLATDASGPVRISDLSKRSIRLDVDRDVDAIDDEFVLYAFGLVIDR